MGASSASFGKVGLATSACAPQLRTIASSDEIVWSISGRMRSGSMRNSCPRAIALTAVCGSVASSRSSASVSGPRWLANIRAATSRGSVALGDLSLASCLARSSSPVSCSTPSAVAASSRTSAPASASWASSRSRGSASVAFSCVKPRIARTCDRRSVTRVGQPRHPDLAHRGMSPASQGRLNHFRHVQIPVSNCSHSNAAACRASSTTSARATFRRVNRSWSGCCHNFMSGSIAASRPVSPFG